MGSCIIQAGKGLRRSCPTSCSQHWGTPGCSGLGNLWGWRWHHIPGQPLPLGHCLHGENLILCHWHSPQPCSQQIQHQIIIVIINDFHLSEWQATQWKLPAMEIWNTWEITEEYQGKPKGKHSAGDSSWCFWKVNWVTFVKSQTSELLLREEKKSLLLWAV